MSSQQQQDTLSVVVVVRGLVFMVLPMINLWMVMYRFGPVSAKRTILAMGARILVSLSNVWYWVFLSGEHTDDDSLVLPLNTVLAILFGCAEVCLVITVVIGVPRDDPRHGEYPTATTSFSPFAGFSVAYYVVLVARASAIVFVVVLWAEGVGLSIECDCLFAKFERMRVQLSASPARSSSSSSSSRGCELALRNSSRLREFATAAAAASGDEQPAERVVIQIRTAEASEAPLAAKSSGTGRVHPLPLPSRAPVRW